jgi:teichuronic acid exporter
MSSFLEKSALKSIKWSALDRITVQILQILVGIVIARLVSPDEYGRVAIANIFIMIIQTFVEAGFTNALIQKQNRSEIDFCTVFYFNILTSILIYSFLYFSSPYIARYYNTPELTEICRCLGIVIATQSLSTIQVAKLSIALDFKIQAKSSLFAMLTSGSVGILLAYKNYGVWALVIQTLMYSLINTLMLWLFVKWSPKLSFSIYSIKSIIGFSYKLMLAGALSSLYIHIYGLMIGRQYSLADVGHFNQANLLARFPSVSAMAIIGRAIYPIQCSIQEDLEMLRASHLKFLCMSCYMVFPAMLSIAALSDPIIYILLSDKWSAAAPLLSILAIAYAITPIMAINNQIVLVKGRSDLFLKAEIVKKGAGVAILIASFQHDLFIVCLGFVFYNVIDAFIIMHYSNKIIGIDWHEQLSSIYKIFLISVVMSVSVYALSTLFSNPYLKLTCGLAFGLTIYLGMSKVLKINEYAYFEKMILPYLRRVV